MKRFNTCILGGALLIGALHPALAQRDPATKADKREARQQANETLTPEQRAQNFQARWQARFNAATPEQQQRMTEMRNQFEQRMKDNGIDPKDPNAFKKMQDAGMFGQGGAGGTNGGAPAANATVQAPPMTKEEMRRQLMNAAGITDRNTQNSILAFAIRQDKARIPLLKLAQDAAMTLGPIAASPTADDGTAKVQAAAAKGGDLTTPVMDGATVQPVAATVEAAAPTKTDTTATAATATAATIAAPVAAAPATDAQVGAAFDTYETALEAERVRYTGALKDLDKEIHFSDKPRLKAFLSLAGILEFDPLAIGGPPAIFAPVLDAISQAEAKAAEDAAAKEAADAEKALVVKDGLPVGFGTLKPAADAPADGGADAAANPFGVAPANAPADAPPAPPAGPAP